MWPNFRPSRPFALGGKLAAIQFPGPLTHRIAADGESQDPSSMPLIGVLSDADRRSARVAQLALEACECQEP